MGKNTISTASNTITIACFVLSFEVMFSVYFNVPGTSGIAIHCVSLKRYRYLYYVKVIRVPRYQVNSV